jgi:hypothetical protein
VAESEALKSRNVISSLELAALDLPAQVLEIRGHRVLLASQLARLYGVQTKVLNQAVQRNRERFPADFMFQLEWSEVEDLKSRLVTLGADEPEEESASRSQTVTLKRGQNLKYAPFAFTEQGVAMLSGVLRSERAVAVNIEIMRTFVKLRSMVSEHADLKRRLNALEKKYDEGFREVFVAIQQLMDEPKPGAYGRRRIGFTTEK